MKISISSWFRVRGYFRDNLMELRLFVRDLAKQGHTLGCRYMNLSKLTSTGGERN